MPAFSLLSEIRQEEEDVLSITTFTNQVANDHQRELRHQAVFARMERTKVHGRTGFSCVGRHCGLSGPVGQAISRRST